MQITLTIKRSYFDAILAGEKIFEYRSNKSYYQKIFQKQPTSIVFHYYKKRRLLVDIVSVALIPKPERFKDSEILTTAEVFAVRVTNPRLIS